MNPLRSLRSLRAAPVRFVSLGVAATLALVATPSLARAHKALVYCPIGIDVAGCTNLVAALQPVFPSGVDRGYDGSGGTVDLRTADLWSYSVIAIPSLATSGGATPYAVLSDTALGSRLHDADASGSGPGRLTWARPTGRRRTR
jgi:opacity protein-like surface antigen